LIEGRGGSLVPSTAKLLYQQTKWPSQRGPINFKRRKEVTKRLQVPVSCLQHSSPYFCAMEMCGSYVGLARTINVHRVCRVGQNHLSLIISNIRYAVYAV